MGDHASGTAERGHWPKNLGKGFGDLQGMSPGSELFLSQSFLTDAKTNCSSLENDCFWAGASVSLHVGFNLENRLKLPTHGCL